MENSRRSLDNEVEKYAPYLDRQPKGLPFPTRLIGLKGALFDTEDLRPGGDFSPGQLTEQVEYFQRLSEDAGHFFLDLKETIEPWICFLIIGRSEVKGHSLQSLDGTYQLQDEIQLFPTHKYHINYAGFHSVPEAAVDYDTPTGVTPSTPQLYIGDTIRRVAISFNQFRHTLVTGGDIDLISSFS